VTAAYKVVTFAARHLHLLFPFTKTNVTAPTTTILCWTCKGCICVTSSHSFHCVVHLTVTHDLLLCHTFVHPRFRQRMAQFDEQVASAVETTRRWLGHLLVCTGSIRQAVCRGLYFTLKAAGVGADTKTFVFPPWVREIVRLRFPGVPQHDAQYEGKNDVYNVSKSDLLKVAWKTPKQCDCCGRK